MNAFQTLLGTETLSLRMERHCSNSLRVAEYLEGHPQVAWVSCAALPSSPYRKLAEKYLPLGAGSVFTLGLKGGYLAGVTLVESCELLSHPDNHSDGRTLILPHPPPPHRQL